MEKKSKFKKLLTTASAFAVIAGASTSAMGADLTTSGNVALNANLNFLPAQAPVNYDKIIIGAVGNTINANMIGLIIDSINLNALNPGLMTVTSSFVLGSVYGQAGNNRLNASIIAGQVLTLSTIPGVATGYDGLGNLGFADAPAGLLIDADATIYGTLLGAGAGNGTITTGVNRNITIKEQAGGAGVGNSLAARSEERRVGKECSS